jgi:two-component system nitrogen regulation response regulator GlnG
VVTIQLPPLRDRNGDVALLAAHFVRQNSQRFGKQIQSIAPETIEILNRYRWPGNVRELESVIKQSLLNARGTVLLPDFLPDLESLSSLSSADAEISGELSEFVQSMIDAGSHNVYSQTIAKVERQLIEQVLEHTHGHQLHASEILGISRVTLRHKIRSLGIDVDQFMK